MKYILEHAKWQYYFLGHLVSVDKTLFPRCMLGTISILHKSSVIHKNQSTKNLVGQFDRLWLINIAPIEGLIFFLNHIHMIFSLKGYKVLISISKMTYCSGRRAGVEKLSSLTWMGLSEAYYLTTVNRVGALIG